MEGVTALARLVATAARIIAGVIVAGILLVVLNANEGNAIVGAVLDVARFFVKPFRSIFDLSDNDVQIALNWGIGAAAYLLAGTLLARLLLSAGGRAGTRRRSLRRRN